MYAIIQNMEAQAIDGIFYVIVLIMSVIVHEFAHGYAAYKLGDSTAKQKGRLTLNPIKHLDPIGSVALPLLLFLSNAPFLIGWAKPVPIDTDKIRKGKTGLRIVASAGILVNVVIAILFGLCMRYGAVFGFPPYDPSLYQPFYRITSIIVVTNLVLALFNLVPIPPLDGSKILYSLLPVRLRHIEVFMEKWALLFLIIFIVFIWDSITAFIPPLFTFIAGIPM